MRFATSTLPAPAPAPKQALAAEARSVTKIYVSEATVKSHFGRVMSKLHLTSRAQAFVVAYESGLVTPGQAR